MKAKTSPLDGLDRLNLLLSDGVRHKRSLYFFRQPTYVCDFITVFIAILM